MRNQTAPQISFVSRAKFCSRVAAVLVMTVGALSIVSGFFVLEPLKSFFGPLAIEANTGVALVLAGISSWTLQERTRSPYQQIGQACALATTLLGLIALAERVSGWNLHLDQLLFTGPARAAATNSPDHMGVTASLCCLMFGVALWLLHRRRARSFAQV